MPRASARARAREQLAFPTMEKSRRSAGLTAAEPLDLVAELALETLAPRRLRHAVGQRLRQRPLRVPQIGHRPEREHAAHLASLHAPGRGAQRAPALDAELDRLARRLARRAQQVVVARVPLAPGYLRGG